MTDKVEQNQGSLLPDNSSKKAAMFSRLEALADKMIAVGQEAELASQSSYHLWKHSKPVADMTRIELAIHHGEVTAEQVEQLKARIAYVQHRWATLSFAELEPVADQITYKQYELARKLGLMTSEPMYGFLTDIEPVATEPVEFDSNNWASPEYLSWYHSPELSKAIKQGLEQATEPVVEVTDTVELNLDRIEDAITNGLTLVASVILLTGIGLILAASFYQLHIK